MKLIEFTNWTEDHPKGVCEAAVCLWLEKVCMHGIQVACKIKPEDCDPRQAEVEGGLFMHVFGLKGLLGAKGKYDPFSGTAITSESDIFGLLKKLVKGDFIFISANKSAFAHALVIYRTENSIYFFDPDNGIYIDSESQTKAMAAQFMTNIDAYLGGGGEIAAIPGKAPEAITYIKNGISGQIEWGKLGPV